MSNDSTPPPTAAVVVAAAKTWSIEAFLLLSVGTLITTLRTYARVRSVGWKRLQVDDYLVWVAAACYFAECILAFELGNSAHALANNGLTPAQRAALSPNSHEYRLRVLGSKIPLAGWTSYGTLLWSLKGSLLVFYTRLTEGLGRDYEIRIRIGYLYVGMTYIIVTLNVFFGCLPFRRNWQIEPDPGNTCQPAVSSRIIYTYLAFNVTTDMYLLSIPLPMLWKAGLRPARKFGLMFLFGGGMFVIACAILRCVIIVTDHNTYNSALHAGSWAVRETFFATLATNLPVVYPLFHRLWAPRLGTWLSTLRSGQRLNESPSKAVNLGAPSPDSRRERARSSMRNPWTNVTFTESEERMTAVENQGHYRSESSSKGEGQGNIIQKQVEVSVESQRGCGQDTGREHQRQWALKSIGGDDNTQWHPGHTAYAKSTSGTGVQDFGEV